MASSGKDSVEFSLDLDTSGSEGAAGAFAGSLDDLQGKIQDDIGALRQMQAALRDLKGGTTVNAAAMTSLKDRIKEQKAGIADSRAAYINMGGTFEKFKAKPREAGNALADFGKAATAAGGPVGSLGGRIAGLASSAAAAGPILLVTAGIVALTAAAAAGAAALIKYGAAQADARRDELLRLEGLTKMRYWYGQLAFGQRLAADSSSFLQESIDRVSDKVALGRGEIEKWTSRLYRMGLRSGNLQQALEGVTIAASTVGESQANMYLQMMMGAAQTGKSVKAVADDIKARLGPLAERQLLSWSVQTTKLRENLQRLFQGIGIENFLRPVKTITDLFSQTEVSGKALRGILERLFRPVEYALPIVAQLSKRFLQGMIIGYLSAEGVVLRFIGTLLSQFGPALDYLAGQLADVDSSSAISAFELLGTALGYAGMMAVGTVVGLALIASGAIGAVQAVGKFVVKMNEALDAATKAGPAWSRVGASIVDGVISGLTGNWPRLIGKIREGGSSLIAAFKDAIGSHSPARKMFQPGFSIGEGAAVGVRASLPKLEAAVRDMARVPIRAVPQLPAPAALPQPRNALPTATGRAPVTLTIGDLIINEARTDNPRMLEQQIRDVILNTFEGLAIEMGAR